MRSRTICPAFGRAEGVSDIADARWDSRPGGPGATASGPHRQCPMRSFFSTIKAELLDRRPWPTRAAAHKAIFNWIEGWYNTRRRHSTLDYLSPAAYEARINQQPGLRQVA